MASNSRLPERVVAKPCQEVLPEKVARRDGQVGLPERITQKDVQKGLAIKAAREERIHGSWMLQVLGGPSGLRLTQGQTQRGRLNV